MLDLFKQVLGNISGGRVLDVATGEGGFVELLARHLKSYSAIIGIDISERVLATASSSCNQENTHFIQMDAECLAFKDESLDTVNISGSLHHLENIPRVLAEMERILKPDGHLIVSEMLRDGGTEPQRNAVCIHHWAAEVDSALGVSHNRTLSRQEIADLVGDLGLCNVAYHDFTDTDSDPMDEAAIKGIENYMDRFIRRAKGAANYEALKQQNEELRQRLHDVGVQREPVLVVTGQKR